MEQRGNGEDKNMIEIFEKLEADYRELQGMLDEYVLLVDRLTGSINYNRKLKMELIEQMGAEEEE